MSVVHLIYVCVSVYGHSVMIQCMCATASMYVCVCVCVYIAYTCVCPCVFVPASKVLHNTITTEYYSKKK